MKNFHTFLIAIISVVFMSTSLFAQENDVAPNLKDQYKLEKQIKEAKAAQKELNAQMKDAVPAPLEDPQKGIYLKKVPGDYVRDVDPDAKSTGITSTADDLFDLQFSWPAGVGGGEAGIETDGNYVYTTKWNGTGEFYQYDMDGTYIGVITVSGAAGIRDLAYNGTYFYGGAGATTVFEVDIENATLISQFTAPTAVRAIAYNEDDDVFYANNWSTDITAFDASGANMGSFVTGPFGASYYGFAYDNYCGGQYLWGYAQVGTTPADQNWLVQIELPSGVETGVTYNVASVVTPVTGIAGGLCITDEVVPGYWTIMGNMQNEFLWGVELCLSGPLPANDLGISAIPYPTSGTGLTAAEDVTVTIKNYGTEAQSNFDVYFTLDGGTAVSETYSGTLNAGETVDHTFGTTVDLSAPGDYAIMACTDLSGDENTNNDCKSSTVSNLTQFWAYPSSEDYWTGTTDGTVKTETSLVKAWGGTGGNEQGWMKFDVSEIPSNSLINWIKFHGYVSNTNFPYWSITPMPLDPVTATAADIWNTASAGSGTADAYAYNNESSTFAPGWHVYDLVNSANADLTAALADGWFAVGIWERDGSATYYLEFDGWNETNVPYLEIDYTVLDYGSIDGTVTELATSNPVDGAMIHAVGPNFTYDVTSGSDGTYSIDPAEIGSYTITCSMDGYNMIEESGVTVVAGSATTQDFALTSPTLEVDPLTVSMTLDPNATGQDFVDISNNGDGALGWNASIEYLNDNGSDDAWDLEFQVDVTAATGAAGNAGAECDGQYYYTTRWASNLIHKYDLTGNMLEEFSIPGVTGLRDLAFDGTYMYGGAAAGVIYEMDFTSQTLVSSISNAGQARSIAYDSDNDAFWISNFGSDVWLIDKTGATLNTIPNANLGLAGMYGSAFENITGTPYLWIFDQGAGAGTAQLIHQVDLTTLMPTGFTYDVMPDLGPDATAIAGGLFMVANVYPGVWSLGGLLQGTPDKLFMYEFAPATGGGAWLTIDPNSGSVDAGGTETMTLNFDATDLLAGEIYNANIHFTSDPDVGEETVEVELIIGDQTPGHITGNVMLDGLATYNIGDVTEVVVAAGPYNDQPDASGNYDITAYPGTYDVTATLYGYATQTTTGVVVPEAGLVENVDFTMPTLYGRIMGTVTDIDSGDPIENATVSVDGTGFEAMTAADGTYEIFIEEGTYDVTADHPTYMAETTTGVAVTAENDAQVDFALTYQCDFCAASGGDDEYIDGFEFGTISNLGTGYVGAGYSDYTDMSTIVIPGMTYTLTIHTGNMYTSDDYGVWIDWNQDCTFDPATENVVCGVDMGADINTWDVTIPANATPGNATLRARLKWSGSDCGDPCGTTSFGEVEDYTLIVAQAIYGTLEGTVTELSSGDPIDGAEVSVGGGSWSAPTNSSGFYSIPDILVGDWDVTCTADGYNPVTVTVTIEEDLTTVQDFALAAPQLVVDPLTLDVTMDFNQTQDETINVSNPGLGTVDWSAAVVINGDKGTDDLFDLQFSWPAGVGGGEAGIETDGNYVYTTKWNGAGEFYRYQMDGTYLEVFTITGAVGVRDLAYDGTYFYGGAGATTVFQCDLDAQTLVSQFTAPTAVRAIAYNEDDDVFYANNWSTDIVAFDGTGANLGSFTPGPFGASYYGFAYDNYSDGAPYLWGYAQVGTTPADQNWLVQMELPSGTETGVTFNVASVVTPVTGIAGGLAITDAIVPGFYTLLGNMQNEFLWGVELSPAGPVWLTIEPNGGTLNGGTNEDITATFNTFDMFPGVYTAQIVFNTTPNVGSPVVDVTLTVSGLPPAGNLMLDWDCTDIMLEWDMPYGGTPDSWNIYRDDVLIGSSTTMDYTDEMMDPEVEYGYTVKAVYGGDESMATDEEYLTVPTPVDMEVDDLAGIQDPVGTAHLTWSTTACCVAPDGYNIFRDGTQINSALVTDTEYDDPVGTPGFYEYSVTAVYYFGESAASNAAYVLITGIDENLASQFEIFPNPASDFVNVRSDFTVESYEVLNNVGQVVNKANVDASNFKVDVAQFESGIYYIKLFTNEGVALRKIAIE